ncbi:MAG: hypothetical protein AAF891_09330 [Pseudomonadota bacterium]
MFRGLFVLIMGLQVQVALAQDAAKDALPRDFGCLAQSQLRNDMHPSELARIVRHCTEAGRFDDAVQVYYTYSSYGLFDQQRVRDESAHVVLGELSQWMFAFLDRPMMNGLRGSIDQMRDPGSELFRDTCRKLAVLGPPDYRPAYMIRYGMMPRKNDDDWQHEVFDARAAWAKATQEINGCPAS